MKKFILLFCIALFVLTFQSNSEWTKVWNGGWCLKIGYFNRVAFISTAQGIYRSLDSGKTWTPSNNGLTPSYGTAFGYCDGVYYVALKEDGLYKSLDSGTTWVSCNLKGDIYSIITKNNSVYAGLNRAQQIEEGIYRSDDKGISWNCITRSYPSEHIRNVTTMDYNDKYLFNATGYGVFRTSDDGATWEHMEDDQIEDDDTREFVCAGGDVVYWNTIMQYYSTNNGETWIESEFQPPCQGFAKYKNMIFSVYDKVIYSKDSGLTWLDYCSINELAGETFYSPISIIGDNICIGTLTGLYSHAITGLSGVQEKFNENILRYEYDPTNDLLLIKENTAGIIEKVEIYSFCGSKAAEYANSNGIISIASLGSGIYFIKTTVKDQSFFQKIIVLK